MRPQGAAKERVMKVTVIKKAGDKVKPMSVCPWVVEGSPDSYPTTK
jgi:hypothetical protein